MAASMTEKRVRAIVREELARVSAGSQVEVAPERPSSWTAPCDHALYAPPPVGSTEVECLNDQGEWVAWDGAVNAALGWSYIAPPRVVDHLVFSTPSGSINDGRCGNRVEPCAHLSGVSRSCDRFGAGNGAHHKIVGYAKGARRGR